MSPKINKVCIIGAGCSGFVSVKTCLEEGLNPTCYEITGDIGGLWNREERIRLNIQPFVYTSLVTNFSKANNGFSDFAFPKDWSPYLPWHKMLEYQKMYVDHYDLRRHIKFNTKVTKVYKSSSYKETGSWIVETLNLMDDKVEKNEFDAVIVATGKYSASKFPEIPGFKENYKGKMIHSSEYIGNKGYEDKSILVIGGSNSGCDIAADLADVAKNVFLSTRRGTWLLPRILQNGLPLDLGIPNRFAFYFINYLPSFVMALATRSYRQLVSNRLDYQAAGMMPKLPPTNAFSTRAVNDLLPSKIYAGKVKARPGIKEIDSSNKVQFVDGQEEKVDLIIAATGFDVKMPFLSEDIFPSLQDSNLYQWIFPIKQAHPSTLVFVGLYPEQSGPGCVQIELQARYAVGVMSERIQLPAKAEMAKHWKKSLATASDPTGRFTFKVPLCTYQEDLANELGLIPSFKKMLFTDPSFAMKLYFGPIIPAHYRVIGEHRWSGAREEIFNVFPNVKAGMK